MHAKISHKTKKQNKNQSHSSPTCVPDFINHYYMGSSSKSWKDCNKHTFIPWRRKRHLGPVKMIKSITYIKAMWGMRRIQFYSLKLGRHLNQKEEDLRFESVLCAELCTYRCRAEDLVARRYRSVLHSQNIENLKAHVKHLTLFGVTRSGYHN